MYIIYYALGVSGITFIRYAQNQNIGKSNNKSVGARGCLIKIGKIV